MSGWEQPVGSATRHRDPRLLGIATAAIVVGYAVFLGAVAAGLVPIPSSTFGDIGPGHTLDGIWLAVGLAVPGAIAAIGAVRRSGPLLVVAGVLCMAQSLIAFSGATLPFLAPAAVLIALGAGADQHDHGRRETLAGVGVVVIVLAGWVVGFGMTETRCWTATEDAAGGLVYAEAPESDTQTLNGDIVAAGCDGGAHTAAGIVASVAIFCAAVALAAWGTRPGASPLNAR